jgi:hypothetical protein
MARRRKKDAISISLVPILSIQKCAMGLMVVIICAQTTVSIATTTEKYLEAAEPKVSPRRQPFVIVKTPDIHWEMTGSADGREAVFVECRANEILIHPEQKKVPLDSLKPSAQSAFHQLLEELDATRGKKRLVLLIRPDGIGTYQRCFDLARSRTYRYVDVGKDVLPAGGALVLTKDGKEVR